MNPPATAALLTAPVAVPLATCAVYAAGSLRGRTAKGGGATDATGAGSAGTGSTGSGATGRDATGTGGAGTGGGSRRGGSRSGGADTGGAFPGATADRRPPRGPSGWAAMASPAAILASGAVLAAHLTGRPGAAPPAAYGDLLRGDALTAWLLLVVGAVSFVACAASPGYLAGERAAGRASARTARRYHVLVHAFLAAMCLAVVTANLGVLWVAVEATTIVTAFLVGHRRTRRSVEAAWKYVVICSAGIALALLGTVLIYYAARQAGVSEAWALDWPTLVARADRLDPAATRLGIALVVLGYGTKAGLVPMHAWLPDAHSQAPAPVSALMSGVLLSVAFGAVLRYRVIAVAALGPGFTRGLLACVALATLAVAAALLLAQRDYKRMLAYSSMEHMGLVALAAAIGSPLALSAALLHIAGHGLAKSAAFCTAGRVLHLTGTTETGRVRGLLVRSPRLGGLFGLAVVALLGFPPFSLFASELALVRAGFAAGGGTAWMTAAALVLVLVAFASLTRHAAAMLLGPAAPSGVTTVPMPAAAPEPAPMPAAAVPVVAGGPAPTPAAAAGPAAVSTSEPVPAPIVVPAVAVAPATVSGAAAPTAAASVAAGVPMPAAAVPVVGGGLAPGSVAAPAAAAAAGTSVPVPGPDLAAMGGLWAAVFALVGCAVVGVCAGPLGDLLARAAGVLGRA